MKKIISVLLTITMLLGITASVPLSASAVTADKLESSTAYTDKYGSWLYELTDNGEGYRIISYQGNQSYIQIPKLINNVPVVEIGEYAFSQCENLTRMLIPSTITTIGKSILSENTSFREVYYEGSVDDWCNILMGIENYRITGAYINFDTYIESNEYGTWVCAPHNYYEGYQIVSYSGDTTRVIIPREMNNTPIVGIAESVFSNYNNLTSVLIPNSIREISYYAFENCINLTDVYYVGTSNEWYNTFIQYDGNKTFVESYIHFDSCIINNECGAWVCAKIDYQESYKIIGYLGDSTQIVIPSEVNNTPVVEIGEYVFANNSSMRSIVIPDSIVKIDRYAFENCINLTDVYYTGEYNEWCSIFIQYDRNDILWDAEIYFNTGLLNNEYGTWICSYIDYYPNDEYGKNYKILSYLGDKTEITVPSEVNNIPVIEIGEYVFANNSSMTSIVIPDSIVEIDKYAFENCTSLTDVYYTGDEYDWGSIHIDYEGNDCLHKAYVHLKTNIINDKSGIWVFEPIEYNKEVYRIKSYSGDATTVIIPSEVNNTPVVEIGEYVFANNSSMTSIVISDSIVGIGECAFKNCTSLTDVYYTGSEDEWNTSIPINGNDAIIKAKLHYNTNIMTDEFGTWVCSFGDYYDRYKIVSYLGDATKIVVPSKINNIKIEEIGKSLFENNTNLTKVVIPDSIIFIDEYAFNNCNAITDVYYTGTEEEWFRIGIGIENHCLHEPLLIHYNSIVKNDNYGAWMYSLETFDENNQKGYMLTEYLGNASRITIPSELNNIPVLGLGEELFKNCSNLTKVIIPESIIHIDRDVFFNCNNLTQVYYTGKKDDWNKLQVDSSNHALFMAHINYDTIIKTDEFGAWVYDPKFPNGCLIIDYIGNMSELRVPSEIDNVPVVNIISGVFKNYNKLTQIILPDSILGIDASTFKDCTKLSDVYYEGSEDSWNNILSNTQENAPLLKAKIHYDTQTYSDIYGVWTYKSSDFGGYAITNYIGNKNYIRIPSEINNVPVMEIGEFAFAFCDNLTCITLSKSITVISEFAFLNCINLYTVYYSGNEYEWNIIEKYEGNRKIEYATIYYDTKTITDEYGTWILKLTDERDGYIITDYLDSTNNNVKAPSGIDGIPVVEIADSLFSELHDITSVTIPDSVKTIGQYAFYNCESLTSVILSKNLTSIGEYAFYNCESLTDITLPENLTSIGQYAFYNCNDLTTITIPDGVKVIDYSTFSNCESLTNVTLPNTLTTLDYFAFSYCKNLTSITLPDSLTTLDYGAFYQCTGLKSITIPDKVTEIDFSVFNGCTNLTNVTLPKNLITISNSAFYSCKSLTNITIPNSVTSIKDSAFYACQKLTSITIPDNVTSIGSCVFTKCSSLSSIETSAKNKNYISVDGVLFDKTQSKIIAYPAGKLSNSYNIPNGITSIPDYLFSGCNNLNDIIIPDSVTSIGRQAFSYCENLTDIKIPDSVTSIGDDAFYYCSSLNNVTLPKNITSIADGAFSYCKNLTSITIPKSVTTIELWAFNRADNISDIYYTGSEAEWNNISIAHGNDSLANATKHYNYVLKTVGDVNGDGTLAVNDIIYVLKNIVGTQFLTDEQIALADISGDGKLTVVDAIMLQRIILDMV